MLNGHYITMCFPSAKLPAILQASKCYWALLNRFWTSLGHCASCRKKWGLAATDMCPCGKCQKMSCIVNSFPLTKLEGGVATEWLSEDIQLVTALDNNNYCLLFLIHCHFNSLRLDHSMILCYFIVYLFLHAYFYVNSSHEFALTIFILLIYTL